MQKIILVMLLAFANCSALAENNSVKTFEKFLTSAEKITNTEMPVTFYNGTWRKYRYTVTDLKFDIKKTDSLVSPLIGLVTFNLVTEVGEKCQTEEDVLNLKEFEPKDALYDQVSLRYSYRNNKWIYSNGSKVLLMMGNNRSELKIPSMKFPASDLTEEDLKDDPYKYWVPK